MAKRSEILGFEEIADLEERRATRRSLGAVEATSILKGNDNWRFHFTIKEAVEHSEVWFVNRPDGTLIDFMFDGQKVSPFWPHEDVAKLACQKMNVPGETNPMPLDYWIDNELDLVCRADNCVIALCPSDGYAELKTVDEVFSALAQYGQDPQAYWDRHFSGDRLYLTQNLSAGPKGRLP